MMNAAQIPGLAVVSVPAAVKLGRVSDVLFSIDDLRAAALRVKTEEGEGVLAIEDVRSIGADAVTTDLDATPELGEGRSTVGLDAMRRLKVVDEDGMFLGRVNDLFLDPSTGRVLSVTVRKGDVLGVGGDSSTIDVRDVLAVGDDVMTVRAADR